MAEAGSQQDQWEEGFEDEFGEIIKTRSGRRNYELGSLTCCTLSAQRERLSYVLT